MSQMIVRFDSDCEDVDVLIAEGEKEIIKSFSLERFREYLDDQFPRRITKKPRLIDPGVIAVESGILVFRQPEMERPRYAAYNGKVWKIHFPNALYYVEYTTDRITKIDVYTWFGRLDLDSDLYAMPMPNMTGSEHLCIGTADRIIKDGDVIRTVEKIMDAQYTHDHVDNLKESTSTLKWFGFLENNSIREEMLKNPKCKLKDLVETSGNRRELE